jgi:protoporphyrinogen IX oxidase
MSYELLKSLHIIFVITWFAGLFYVVRLNIYHVESMEHPSLEVRKILHDQFSIMQKRLWYIITWPSAIITLLLGPSLLQFYWPLSLHPWLHLKITLVFLLYVYHFLSFRITNKILKQNLKNTTCWTSQKLRMWNEVSTMLLFPIVFLAVYKSLDSWPQALVFFILLGVVMMIAIKLYRRQRG